MTTTPPKLFAMILLQLLLLQRHYPAMAMAMSLPRWTPSGLYVFIHADTSHSRGSVVSSSSSSLEETASSGNWKDTAMLWVQDLPVVMFLAVGMALIFHCWKARFQQHIRLKRRNERSGKLYHPPSSLPYYDSDEDCEEEEEEEEEAEDLTTFW
eukprot:scaffold43688_cov367-Amphora_coffeaeformis.AAC.3